MRWLVDECVDAGLVSHLRAHGHDVIYLAEVAPAASDTEIMLRAQVEERILLTEDKDFGDLVFRRRHSVPAVVLLPIHPAMHERKDSTGRRDQPIWREFVQPLYNRRRRKISLATVAALTAAFKRSSTVSVEPCPMGT